MASDQASKAREAVNICWNSRKTLWSTTHVIGDHARRGGRLRTRLSGRKEAGGPPRRHPANQQWNGE